MQSPDTRLDQVGVVTCLLSIDGCVLIVVFCTFQW